MRVAVEGRIASTSCPILNRQDGRGRGLGGPDKNFLLDPACKLRASDPNKDVDGGPMPGNLLKLAVEKGRSQGILASDPIAYLC